MPFGVIDPTTAALAPVSTLGDPLDAGGFDLATLRSELAKMLGSREDVDEPRLDMWINMGYIDLCSMLRLDELKGSLALTTAPGQPFYGLPGCVGTTTGASIIDTAFYITYGGRPLDKITLEEYRRRVDQPGKVEAYFRHGQIIVLWPTPANVYSVPIDFMIRPTVLTLPTDHPILPAEWHEAILLNAKVKAYNGLGEPENELAADNAFERAVAKKLDKKVEEDVNRVPRSVVVRSRPHLYRNVRLPRSDD